MVSATIPGYRAARHAVERDLDRVRRLGVEFRYGQEVGTSITLASLRREGFGAIVIAVGARRGRPLGLRVKTPRECSTASTFSEPHVGARPRSSDRESGSSVAAMSRWTARELRDV